MRTIITRIFFIFTLFTFPGFIQAQDPAFKNYTTEDGLPSNNVYSTFQDEDGFIWFATDNGVSKFDGRRFKNFSISDGLTDNEILNIVKDIDGRIWFLPFNGKLCFYQNGKIFNSSNCTLLKKVKLTANPGSFFQDSKKNIWLGLVDNTIVIIPPDGNMRVFNRQPVRIQTMWKDKNDNLKILSGSMLWTMYDDEFRHYDSIRLPSLAIVPIIMPKDSNLIFICKNDIVESDMAGKILSRFPFNKYIAATIQSIFSDNFNNIWVSTSIGVVEFENGVLNVNHEHPYFSNYSITNTFQDKENNFWYSSYGNGVFLVPSLSIKVIDTKSGLAENNISSISVIDSNKFLAGMQNGITQLIENFVVESKKKPFIPPSGRLINILKDTLGNIWILTDNDLFKYEHGKFSKLKQENGWFKSLYIGKDGAVWIGRGRGLSKLEKGELKTMYRGAVNRVYSIVESGDSGLLLGTETGLYHFKDGKMREEVDKDSLLHHHINALAYGADSALWIATDGYGLVRYKNKTAISYSIKNNLLSNHCNGLLAEGKKLYLATDKGLNIITLTNNDKPEIKSYSTANGLVSNHINKVVRKNDKELMLATDRGIIIYDENKIPVTSRCTPYINSISINDNPSKTTDSLLLHSYENNIGIEFSAVNFRSPDNIRFRYKLTGVDSSWNYTSSHSVKYSHLTPGQYYFVVLSQDASGTWSKQKAGLGFYIETPWWQTWWFKITSGLIIAAIITLLILWRIKVYKKKLEQQKSMAESELKALRSQINPHFIYNSLNSIQDFIMQNQKEDANLYLAKFAKLMRNILSHSRTSKITLAEEIESLSLYLELESLRFNNQFTFNFEIDDQVNPEEVTIPSMIIQPYVENSVLHGLASRAAGGKINISFMKRDSFLICSIMDNGIGRKKAQELKQQKLWKGSKSLGMKITQERIDLLSIQEKQKIDLKIEDLTDEQNNPTGTRVSIFFPVS